MGLWQPFSDVESGWKVNNASKFASKLWRLLQVQQLMREEQCNEDELLQRLISSASSLARPPISSFHVG